MIDWRVVSKQYNLSPEEFKSQIYATACAVGSMEIDMLKEPTQILYTSSDKIGKIEMTIRRVS